MGHRAADNRADNTEHDCPHDRQMRMHERLGDATYEEADENIPNEVKHIFLFNFCDLEINPSNSKIADRKPCKRNDQ